jgi:hypothetical protein
VDLKQVAKLFNETLAAIRHDVPDFGGLEPYATEWLKDAQDKLMHDIETAYVHHDLALSRSGGSERIERADWRVRCVGKT